MIRKNRLAVCFITSSLVNESFGGIQNFVLEFSQWLIKSSIEVVVVSNSFEAFAKSVFFDDNHGVTEIKRGRFSLVKYTPSIIRSFIFTFVSFLEIVRRNKEFSFSIIHAQDVSISGFAGTIAHKLFRIPLVTHAHGPSPYFFDATPEATKLQRILAKCLAKVVIDNSNLLIATDTCTKNLFLSFIDEADIVCIPTPINTKAYSIKKETCIGRTLNAGLILGFIGRLSPQKNLRILLNAFASVKKSLDEPIKLVIVGDGPEKSLLMREAERLKVNKEVVFTGAVTENNKIELLNSFDIFLLPSLYEGCPIALLEAMATGKAIITSDIPSIREILRHDEEAILANPYDVEELKRAILLLYNDPSLRTKLGNKALERAKLYDANNIFNHLLETYRKLICHAR